MQTPTDGTGMIYLSRRYRFAASHRLYTQRLSDMENRVLFGKCANPNGHGHNYQLVVTVGGEIDPLTGMVFDLGVLDELVGRRIVERYDHKYLNLDVEDYMNLVPTGENIVRRIWQDLAPALPHGKLKKLLLVETRDNYFECSAEGMPE